MILSPTEGALVILSIVIAVLLAITLVFSVYALLLRVRNGQRERLTEMLKSRWEGPVLAAIVDPTRVDEVHEVVPEKYRLHFVNFILEYTRRVRGEERQTLRLLASPYLDLIVGRMKHRDAGRRARAVQTLGTLGLPAYSSAVLDGLRDESPLVSMTAARYLARREFPEFAPAVLEHIDSFDSWNRRFLASMLAEMGSEVSGTLRGGLTDDTRPDWLKAVFAEALRTQRDPLAGDPAAAALGQEPDRELAASLLRLIAEVGRVQHLPVVRSFTNSEDEMLRSQAMHALGLLTDGSDLSALVEGLDDSSPWTAIHAARGVKEAGGRTLLEGMVADEHQRNELAGQILFEEGEP